MRLAEGITNPALSPSIGAGDYATILNTIIGKLLALAMIAGTLFFFFYLITGAIGYITAQGDKAKITEAQGHIQTALTGIVILFSVFAILKVVGSIFGITALQTLIIDLTPYFE